VLTKLKDHQTGYFKLTWRGFLLYSPISVLSFPVTVLVGSNDSNFLALIGCGVILTILTFAFYLLLIKIVKTFGLIKKYPLSLFLLIPSVTGIFRGYLFYTLIEILGFNQPSSLNYRLSSSLLNTLFWLALANYLINLSQNFLFQYQSALKEYLSNNHKVQAPTKISPENLQILDNLQLNLGKAVNSYLGKVDSKSFQQLSSNLSTQINDQIRPLSKRIWIRNLTEFPVINYRQLFRDGLRDLQFSWLIFTALMSLLSIFGNLAIRGLYESTLRTCSYLLLIYMIRIIYIRISKLKMNQLNLNLIALASFGLIPVLISEYLMHILGFTGDWVATILISPIAPVLMLTLCLINLTRQDRALILKILKSKPNDFTPLQDRLVENASIASFLHNSLQSELLALSLQLQEAAKKDDPEKSAHLLEQVSARINRSLSDDFLSFNQTPSERLKSIISAWQGILEITVSIEEELLEVNNKAPLIVQSIAEVATNVSRYDQATKLTVIAQLQDHSTQLTFQTNGTGKLIKASGIGSAWFDFVAKSPVGIEKNSQGTLITLKI
jgi:hypothetical protein